MFIQKKNGNLNRKKKEKNYKKVYYRFMNLAMPPQDA